MKTILLLLCLFACAAAGAAAGDDRKKEGKHPDLSGTWTLDRSKSDFGVFWDRPLAKTDATLVVVHNEPELKVTRTLRLNGREETKELVYYTDGRGESNPIDKKPGRIPGALNAPWNEPLPELPDGELVAYCGSGVTATVVLHRLHLAGREGKLYPGSWSEWEQRDLPVEKS